ncbi:MAG: hypothetical protein AAGD12_17360, partial [Pseudomonadota bacterium]
QDEGFRPDATDGDGVPRKGRSRSTGRPRRRSADPMPTTEPQVDDTVASTGTDSLPAAEATEIAPTKSTQSGAVARKTASSAEHDGGRSRPSRSRRRGDTRQDDTPVVGLGDHVPAFLLREIKRPTRGATQLTDADSDTQASDDAADESQDEAA